jgi:hypothetical protein
MKLKKENFKKEGVDGDLLYTYTCNGTDFKMGVWGYEESDRTISVWKGEEAKKEFKDVLDAWNYFEELLKECQPEQESSGGYMKDPQQNPNILPLLAIHYGKAKLFALLNDGSQVVVFEFSISVTTMPSQITDSPFVVDWSNQDVPDILKCEVLMKKYDLSFEDDPSADVFLFIPKSIVSQGGDEGGQTSSGTSGSSGSSGSDGTSGSSGSSGSDGTSGSSGSSGSDGTSGSSGSSGSQGSSGSSGSSGSRGSAGSSGGDIEEDRESQGFQTEIKKGGFSQLMQKLSDCTGIQISILVSTFRNVNSGVAFFGSLNFSKIKECMGVPAKVTMQELSQSIINSK